MAGRSSQQQTPDVPLEVGRRGSETVPTTFKNISIVFKSLGFKWASFGMQDVS